MLTRKGTMKEVKSFFQTPSTVLSGEEMGRYETLRDSMDNVCSDNTRVHNEREMLDILRQVNAESSDRILAQLVVHLRKRIGVSSKYAQAVYNTLCVIQVFVRYGGERMHRSFGTNFFLQEMQRISKKYTVKEGYYCREVQEKVMDLIHAWGEAFPAKTFSNYKFVNCYCQMRMEGVVFKQAPDSSLFPIFDLPSSGSGTGTGTEPGGADSSVMQSVGVSAGGGRDTSSTATTSASSGLSDEELIFAAINSGITDTNSVYSDESRSRGGSIGGSPGTSSIPGSGPGSVGSIERRAPAPSRAYTDSQILSQQQQQQQQQQLARRASMDSASSVDAGPVLDRGKLMEMMQTLRVSVSLFTDILMAADSPEEVCSEVGRDVYQRIRDLHAKLADLPELRNGSDSSSSSVLEKSQLCLWAFSSLSSGRCSLEEAKHEMNRRPSGHSNSAAPPPPPPPQPSHAPQQSTGGAAHHPYPYPQQSYPVSNRILPHQYSPPAMQSGGSGVFFPKGGPTPRGYYDGGVSGAAPAYGYGTPPALPSPSGSKTRPFQVPSPPSSSASPPSYGSSHSAGGSYPSPAPYSSGTQSYQYSTSQPSYQPQPQPQGAPYQHVPPFAITSSPPSAYPQTPSNAGQQYPSHRRPPNGPGSTVPSQHARPNTSSAPGAPGLPSTNPFDHY